MCVFPSVEFHIGKLLVMTVGWGRRVCVCPEPVRRCVQLAGITGNDATGYFRSPSHPTLSWLRLCSAVLSLPCLCWSSVLVWSALLSFFALSVLSFLFCGLLSCAVISGVLFFYSALSCLVPLLSLFSCSSCFPLVVLAPPCMFLVISSYMTPNLTPALPSSVTLLVLYALLSYLFLPCCSSR